LHLVSELFSSCFHSLSVVYPYLHLSTERFQIKDRSRDAETFKKDLPPHIKADIEQGEMHLQKGIIHVAHFAFLNDSFCGSLIIDQVAFYSAFILGAYMEIDRAVVASENYVIAKSQHIIFIGLRK
jgi:hypothetical protein